MIDQSSLQMSSPPKYLVLALASLTVCTPILCSWDCSPSAFPSRGRTIAKTVTYAREIRVDGEFLYVREEVKINLIQLHAD